jgi:TonB family protein
MTYIGAVTCALSMLLATAAAQSSSESKSDARSQEAVPVEVYTAPHVKKIDVPRFPAGESYNAGWVELAFMVDSSGKPFEVTVIRSTGNKTFEKVATKAIERSSFEPGTLNGKPVESGYEMKYLFANDWRTPGANRDFVSAYRSVTEAIKAGNRTAADAALQKLKITNLYEDAYFGLATYNYASKWGDESQQLEGLRRAIAREDKARYLPNDLFRFALFNCMQLELKTHEYAEAMTTWKRLEKSGIDNNTATQLRSVGERLEKLRSDASAYEVSGLISDSNWYLHLFKRHFQAVVSEGYISEVRLRCDKHYVFFPFDSTLQYQVNSKDGNCSIELAGAPGTRFKLIQF